MTNNQVQYWALRESARHNQETEAQNRQSIAETIRHNRETEQQGWTSINISERQLSEQMRHNLVAEDQQQQSINESVRHNVQTEAIGFSDVQAKIQAASISAGAVIQSAQIKAATDMRAQDIGAFVSSMEIGISRQNADTNALNAETKRREEIQYEQDSAARQFGTILHGVGEGVSTAGAVKSMTAEAK